MALPYKCCRAVLCKWKVCAQSAGDLNGAKSVKIEVNWWWMGAGPVTASVSLWMVAFFCSSGLFPVCCVSLAGSSRRTDGGNSAQPVSTCTGGTVWERILNGKSYSLRTQWEDRYFYLYIFNQLHPIEIKNLFFMKDLVTIGGSKSTKLQM